MASLNQSSRFLRSTSTDARRSRFGPPLWSVSNAPKIGAFPIKAVTASGKYQYLLAQAPITHGGFPSPALLPINWPGFLGLQGPVEIVKLTNGKLWGTVVGQVINGTGKILDITHISVKLKDQDNATVQKGNFTTNLLVDQDILGQPVNPPLNGAVLSNNAPLPKFYDGFEVPATFKKGTLKVQADVKFHEGTLDCYGDARTLDVKLAPTTVMGHLPYGVPVIGGMPNPAFRCHWGNGIGGTSFNAHSYPDHRYSYDIGVFDSNNQTFKDPAQMDKNDNYYCWGQDVLALISGKVLFIANDFEDNFGNVTNPNSKGANAVVIYNQER